ncbi:hypothetical protein JGD92_23135, partial [Salmonella enterica subsp. enterica serovar Kentucky]|nr:hypothetical protein [Salmonella enterica subsp. enterica serovar Kentucky]
MSQEYINGMVAFRRAAEQNMLKKGIKFMYCPCIDCGNMKMFNNPAQIEVHLIRRGFKKGYTYWTSHGEEQIIPEVNNDDIAEEVNDLPDVDCAFDDDLDQMQRDAEENYSKREFGKFEGLMKDSGTPLFPGCKSEYTRLSTVLELLQ